MRTTALGPCEYCEAEGEIVVEPNIGVKVCPECFEKEFPARRRHPDAPTDAEWDTMLARMERLFGIEFLTSEPTEK